MLKLLIASILFGSALSAPRNNYQEYAEAEPCDYDKCKLPNCLCMSSEPPENLNPSEIPQLVLLTFDDAVSVLNMHYYQQAFYNRKNPNGCPVGTTYFVSHEYTDYSKVHDLWAHGHEIALHSITHQTPTTYWASLDVEGQKRQFADQVDLISTFANISRKDIQGIRSPFLQPAGDNSFQMIKDSSLSYDCSWPTVNLINSGLWPYTLDYKSNQDCPIKPCPTSSIPGVWVIPMVSWKDSNGVTCSMVDSCPSLPDTVDELVSLMIENFKRHYNGSRSPFGFYVHAAWFDRNPEVNFPAYLKFLDYLQGLNDVYLVTAQKALEWVQNPTKLSDLGNLWKNCVTNTNTCGNGKSCRLMKGQEERYMTTCTSYCPEVYPWLNNPLGKN